MKLLSMSTGRPHPSAKQADIPLPFGQASDFEIRINGTLLGLLAVDYTERPQVFNIEPVNLLMVWNWRSGEKLFVGIFLSVLVLSPT